MDQVLLTFGFLVMKFRDEKMNQDPIGCDAIINSVEARWNKSDQEIFITTVLVIAICEKLVKIQINTKSAQFMGKLVRAISREPIAQSS